MARFINPRPQFLNDDGEPLAFGKIFIYGSGSSTLKDLFFDVNLSIAAPNPVILTGSGRMPNTFFSGSSRQVLTDSDEVQFFDIDPVSGESAEGAFSDWNAVTIYSIPEIVVGSDDLFYIAITNNTQGDNPTTSPLSWSQIKFIGVYNTNETYSINDIAQGSDGLLYSSKTGSNTGNDPVTDTTNWGPASNSATLWVGPDAGDSTLVGNTERTVDVSAATVEKTLPFPLNIGDPFTIHVIDSTDLGNLCRVLANGNTITFKDVDIGGDLTIANGESVTLVATSTSTAEIS